MDIRVITTQDDLESLVEEINGASWDDANEISEYNEEALRAYLQREDTLFLACHGICDGEPVLMGIASSRVEAKPYGPLWLYVDEVDVCSNHRQKGAGKFIMRKLLEISEARGCDELWLGAEADNHPANALYRSLEPDDVAKVVGYTYETDQ